ncbi:MAG: nucleoside hydrolase, partial [Anaerolineales bacterium]|nr:nucleoside hydrolase [Anaerolineales bacterium]
LMALFSNTTTAWVLACTTYVIIGLWQSHRWSNLQASWWLGWMLTSFTFTSLQLIPAFQTISTLNLLVGFTVFNLILFSLFALRNRHAFHHVVMISPVALELARFILFRDLVDGLVASRWMTIIAAVLYGFAVVALMEWNGERHRWITMGVGTAVYALMTVIFSWPMILSYILLYSYLPLLLILFATPILGGLALRNIQMVDYHRWSPQHAVRLTLPLGVLLLCGWLTVAFYSQPTTTAEAAVLTNQARQKVIIDTDMSFDDYVAVMYLLQHPNIEVVGITSVHGVASLSAGTENIRRLLALTEQESIPVAVGAAAPLATERQFPSAWANVMNNALRPTLPPVTAAKLPSATSLMHEVVLASPDEVTIIALGPLTNLAELFTQDAAIASQIGRIVIGGGAIDAPNPTADGEKDWNLWLDPAANDIVLNAGTQLWVTPLDLTHYGLLFDSDFAGRWTAANQESETNLMTLIPSVLIAAAGQSQPIWDMVTAAVVTNPEICSNWQTLSLSTIHGDGETAGFLQVNHSKPANAHVCMQGDQTTFETAILNGTN